MLPRIFALMIFLASSAHAESAADKEAIGEVMQVLDQYMVTFNKMDVAEWEKTFHFPHYRLASGQMNVLQKPGEQDQARMRARFKEMGWHHSAWTRRKIVHMSDTKVHVNTQFTRYRADGSIIKPFDSLYILTKQDGRWGIKLRSSYAQ